MFAKKTVYCSSGSESELETPKTNHIYGFMIHKNLVSKRTTHLHKRLIGNRRVTTYSFLEQAV